MGTAYEENVKLNGVLYVHRITDTRVTGTNKRNLLMFKKLCGDDFYPRVFLVGTMWDKVKEAEGRAREDELVRNSEFWGTMVEKGARVMRHWGNRDSAMAILFDLIDRDPKVNAPTVLQVQKEMVDENRTLDETSAGQQFEAELIKQREKHAKEMKQMQEDIKSYLATNEQKLAEETQKEKLELEARIEQSNLDQAMLRKSLQDMQKQQEDEIERLKAQVEEERAAYQAKIERLEAAQSQLPTLDPSSPTAVVLQEQIVQDAADAEELENDIAAKNKNIRMRLKRK
jgi:myosin heavy subunit